MVKPKANGGKGLTPGGFGGGKSGYKGGGKGGVKGYSPDNGKGGYQGVCHHCGVKGHKKYECPNWDKPQMVRNIGSADTEAENEEGETAEAEVPEEGKLWSKKSLPGRSCRNFPPA